jgi:hypothetical protein
MTMQRLLGRSAASAALAIFVLAAFGELRPGTAAFLMISVVLAGLVRDLTVYHRAA